MAPCRDNPAGLRRQRSPASSGQLLGDVSPGSCAQPWHLLDVGEPKELQQPPPSGWHIPSTRGARNLWGSALVLGVAPWKAFLSLPSCPACLPRREGWMERPPGQDIKEEQQSIGPAAALLGMHQSRSC